MSWIFSYQCDECGRHKGHANHWFVAALVGYDEMHGLHIQELSAPWLMFGPWNELFARDSTSLHLCSEECAAKLLSKHLGKRPEVAPKASAEGTQP